MPFILTPIIIYIAILLYKLKVGGEELLERFVRGDKSRNAEGSGLGLSIANSLTELQKGEFEVITDGDLFKAVIVFDLV